MVKKRTMVLAFLASPQGQKMLKDVYKKLDTPKNREKLNQFADQFKSRAGELKEKHGPKVEQVVKDAKTKVTSKTEGKLDKAQDAVDEKLSKVEDKAQDAVDSKSESSSDFKPSGGVPGPTL